MTIERTPEFFEDAEQGFYNYGVGAPGSLSVRDGSTLTMDTQGQAGPYLVIGREAAGDGAVTVTGAGSRIDLISGGSATEGASVSVGRNGGAGALTVQDGATFAISDPTGADGSGATDGSEYLWVGRGADAMGVVRIDAATFDYGGTGVVSAIGREGGRGEMHVTDGGFFSMRSTSDGAQDFTLLRVGADDGDGLMAIDSAMALIQAGRQAEALVAIGFQNGEGRVQIDGSTDMPNRDGLFLTGSAQSPWVGLRVGAQGTGEIEMNGGSLAVANIGRDILREGGTADQDGVGGSAALDVGFAGGTGSLQGAGSQLYVGGHTEAQARFGHGAGSEGTLALSAGSLLTVQGIETGAILRVGHDGGRGSMTLSGEGTRIFLDGRGADRSSNLEIGSRGEVHEGTEGEALIEDGAAVDIAATRFDANLLVGVQGADGTLTIDDASLTLDGARFASIRIGGISWPFEDDQSGTGTLTLQNGARLTATSGEGNSSNIRIGGGDEASEGTLRLLGGSVMDLGGNAFAGVAYPEDGFAGGRGTLALAGDETRLHGLRTLLVGSDSAEGQVTVSDLAHLDIGGLNQSSDATMLIGHRADGSARMEIDNAAVTVQAGNGINDAGQGFEAYTSIGFMGGDGEVTITGDALADPRAPASSLLGAAAHGLVQYGGRETPFSTIDIGRGAEETTGTGAVTMTGGVFGTRNDMLVPGVNLGGEGGGANIRIGLENGEGQLEASGGAYVFSKAGADYAGLETGRGMNADGTRNEGLFSLTEGSRLDLSSIGADAWALIGHEGGRGEWLLADSHAHIAGGRFAGFRIGSHWFDAENPGQESGVGTLRMEDGASVRVEAGQDATLWVGGGIGGEALAEIAGGATMDLDGEARGFVMVGGMAGFLPGTGGSGALSVEGAGSALRGVQDMLVGFNAGSGALTIADGGQVQVTASEDRAGGEAFVGVGGGRVRPDEPATGANGMLQVSGADSQLQIAGQALAALDLGVRGIGEGSVTDGARLTIAAEDPAEGAARLVLGRGGGAGSLEVTGAGSLVSVTAAESAISMGLQGEMPVGDSQAWLTVADGGRVETDGLLLAGRDDGPSGTVQIRLDDGSIAAQLVRINEGAVLAGRGTLEGIAGAPFVQMQGAALRIGDLGAEGGGLQDAIGAMTVIGNVAKADGAAWFDIGADDHDSLSVEGVFAMSGGTLRARWLDGETGLGSTGVRLIEASGGVVLDAVTEDLMSDDHRLELRAEGTELWLVGPEGEEDPDPSPPPVALPPGWRDWFDWLDSPGGAAPPLPGQGSGGGSRGDPHLVTFDGAAYDFHAAGEYVLTRATDGSGLEVQARMAPVAENASANIAAAMRLDGSAVMVAGGRAEPLVIDGVATALEDRETLALGQDLVYRTGNTWHLIHTGDGDTETGFSAVSVTVNGTRVDIAISLDPALQGQVEGLLGNFDGDPATDIALADGTVLERPLRFDDVYGAFRDDWRVDSEAQSLFSYDPGEGPDSFYLPDYPTAMIGLDSFDPDRVAAVEAAVEAAGLMPGTLGFQNAVFDLLLTDDDSYIDSARPTQAIVDSRPEEAPPLDVPDTDGGGLEGLLTLSGVLTGPDGGAMAGTMVTFRPEGRSVNLMRSTREEGEFAFQLSEGASGQLDAMRAYDPAEGDRNITAGDALDVLRIAVGLTPSFGPAAPQNYIAADIDGDGRVTAGDALEVLRHAVGLPAENVPRWVFFDAETDWDGLGLSAANTQVPAGIPVEALAGDTGIGLTGILLGSMAEVV